MFKQAGLIIAFALALGTLRQLAPNGLHWLAKWPTSSAPAEEAYKLMAHPGDPSFISLPRVIEAQTKKETLILDARSEKLFKEGRIPGARNLPYYDYDSKAGSVLKNVEKKTRLIIYCEGITCELSFFLGRQLQKDGFQNVHVFLGGYPEWAEAGLPIEKE